MSRFPQRKPDKKRLDVIGMFNSSNLASTIDLNDRSIENHQTGVKLVNLLDCWRWFVCPISCGLRCGNLLWEEHRHFWFTLQKASKTGQHKKFSPRQTFYHNVFLPTIELLTKLEENETAGM